MGPLPEEVQIELGKNGRVAIRVLDFVAHAWSPGRAGRADGKPIAEELGFTVEDDFEEAVGMDAPHRVQRLRGGSPKPQAPAAGKCG